YHSVFKGRGIDFDEVRPYVAGDDVRRIDWNVTARTGIPHIKKYVEEREMTVIFLVDASASGDIGSLYWSKREIAAELAAILGFSAIANNDRVGLLLFTDGIERYIPPAKGRVHVLGIISVILTHICKSRRTNISRALMSLNHALSRRAVIFILSDFLDSDYERALKVVARKHDVVAVPIIDPIELKIPSLGWLSFEDAETGEVIEINTRDSRAQKLFDMAANSRIQQFRDIFKKSGVDSIEVRVDQPYINSLNKFFETRYHRLNP
ncbi:MAG: DUF58 domain-containing protein, partial [Verrucomicrobiae bacterium]|nr:DUF58 domain-containing protein [Verrucomicrobiae bacterium]